MKHRHFHPHSRRYAHCAHEDAPDGPKHGRHSRGMRRGGRPFDNGELRLVILRLIAEAPCHGYELIKAIEDRMGGTYSPSPGVIYPTLSLLEELGHTTVEADASGRKRYSITPEGQAFLAANQPAVEAIFARFSGAERGATPAPVIRAMENLKLSLRLKMSGGALDAARIAAIAAILDRAALAIEQELPQ